MKFILSFVVCSVLFLGSTTYAQNRASAKNQVISADFVGLFLDGSEFHLQYEWKSTPVNSWFIRALFGSVGNFTGLGVGGGYRFFLADSRALTGLALAPVAHMYFWKSEFQGSELFFSIGGEVSYKWIFDDFSVEPLLGAGLAFGGDQLAYLTKVRPYLGIYLGYAW